MNALDRKRWLQLWKSAEVPDVPIAWYEKLSALYAEPHRHYHDSHHISECLREFDSARHLAKQSLAIEFAIWFHDAIYDPRASDNEEQSARLAVKCLSEAKLPNDLINTVQHLVLATKLHTATNQDSALMIDVDLSILGKDESRFAEYEKQIRQEYAWVPESIFTSKRAEILQRFLDRKRLYATDYFRDKYEISAQRNLIASLNHLRQSSL